jgi:serpin B
MRRWPVFIVCAALILASIGSSPPELLDGEPPADLKPVVDGNSAFALELFARLKDTNSNLILSPYSISSALAFAYGGARGNTEREMSATLHFPSDQKKFHPAMSKIFRTFAGINDGKKVELTVANGLWTQTGYHFIPAFLDLAKNSYTAMVDSADFTVVDESVRTKINLWVERQTKQRIKNALPPGNLSTATRLVIVNTVYFKGDWASQFDAKQTGQEYFWIAPGKSITASMMHQYHEFRYADQDGVQILELPYLGRELSMFIFLPKDPGGLPEMEKQLKWDNVSKWLKAVDIHTVDVRFPKFSIDSRFALNQTLSAMGMSDAFNKSRANFTGMAPDRPLLISALEHAALIEVDEQGTVAAAATHVSFACAKNMAPPPATFHADHPFVFLIRDNHTGTILFLGKILDPTN